MDEFEKARLRAEKRLQRRQQEEAIEEIANEETKEVAITLPRAPKKRSNEITVSVWIDGNEYVLSFKANITGTILGTKQNEHGMRQILLEAFRGKFSNVESI